MFEFIRSLSESLFPWRFISVNATAVKNPSIPINFVLLLYQNLVSWLIISCTFIILSKVFKQKRLRVIDFFGTAALARYPYLFLAGYIALTGWLDPSFLAIDYSKGLNFHPSVMLTIFGFVLIFCMIWQVFTYFFALKEASGLSGIKLWVSFIVSIILGEVISYPITMYFV